MTLVAGIIDIRRQLNGCRHDLARRIGLGHVLPGNIFNGSRRTRLDALRVAVAEEALRRLRRRSVHRSVQRGHRPRAGLPADAASPAFVGIDHPGVDRRDDLDGPVRAGQLAGNRVRALVAGFRDDAMVAPGAVLLHKPGDRIIRTQIVIPADLDPGDRRLRFSVIELAAGQLAAPASHAAAWRGDDHPLGVGHENLPRRRIRGSAAAAPHEIERGGAQADGARDLQELSPADDLMDILRYLSELRYLYRRACFYRIS